VKIKTDTTGLQTRANYLESILSSLKAVDPFKVVLFGSMARGTAHEWSDYDLLVILDTEAIPANFDEKLANRLKVRESIFMLSLEIPIDLVVYSRSEYKNLLAADSPFI
jgi:predicted nucleotidyltransferase